MEQALQDKLLEYLDGIEKGVVDIAPKAYELAVNVNFLAAVIGLITNVVFITLFVGIAVFTTGHISREKDKNDGYADFDDYIGWFILQWVSGVIAVLGMINAMCSTGMWITLVNKDLGFVYTLWQKFIG